MALQMLTLFLSILFESMNRRPIANRSATAAQDRWDSADLAAQAQAAGPHGLPRLARKIGVPSSTLRRWARVARAFAPEDRGARGLAFSHYEAVAGEPGRRDLIREAA